MKIQSTGQKKRSQRGFALVATLSILSLLMMIALAMMTLATTSSRSSAHSFHMEQAKANARLALSEAVGRLQAVAGLDTRITCDSLVADSSTKNPHWVAVYNTRVGEDLKNGVSGKFVVDHHEDSTRYLTDARTETAGDTFVKYLVSGMGEFADGSVAYDDTNSVILLDTGDVATSVRAPLVNISHTTLTGKYGFWISDNSSKVKLNQVSPYSGSSNSATAAKEEFYDGALAQAPYVDDLSGGGVAPFKGHSALTSEKIGKMLTLDTVSLKFPELTRQQVKSQFHNVATVNRSLLVNPILGGLKRDLSSFIETGSTVPSVADADYGVQAIDASTPIIAGDHHNMTGPRFGVFKDWADLRFDISSSSGAAYMNPKVSSDSFVQGHAGGGGTENLNARDLTMVRSNYVQPILVESSLGWDFSPYSDGTGVEKMRTHIFPRVTLWNPYNVTLKLRGFVTTMRIPWYGTLYYRGTGQLYKKRYADLLKKSGNKWEKGTVGFLIEDIDIPPGETRVFSPSMSKSTGTDLHGKAREYKDNYASNVLSADAPPGIENFYRNSDFVLTVPETAGNANLGYGYSNNGNNFHGGFEICADQYSLLQPATPGATSITYGDTLGAKYYTVARFIAQAGVERWYYKWHKGQRSNHAVNGGVSGFREFKDHPDLKLINRRAPKIWRRGVRLCWYDEYEEFASNAYGREYNARLSKPLFAGSNVRGGIVNHPSAHGVRYQNKDAWELPYLNSHRYFKQATDLDDLVSFFPPSPIAAPADSFPNVITLYDIPRKNPGLFSLGQFQHVQFSYLPWTPTFALGQSFSTPQADLDATALRSQKTDSEGLTSFVVDDPDRWGSSSSSWNRGKYTADGLMQRASTDSTSSKKHGDEVVVYDFSYELNHSLWDHYFLSGIPYTGAKGDRSLDWKAGDPLPFGKFSLNVAGNGVSNLDASLASDPSYPFYHSAEFLVIDGALNVNCSNEKVWLAHLKSLRGKGRPNLAGETSASDYNFSRSILPAEGGKSAMGTSQDIAAWNAFRSLNDSELESLATQIVAQIRLRGPSMSLSDFINRRLSNDDAVNRSGVLQAAIDATEINADLEENSGDPDAGDFSSDNVSDTNPYLATVGNEVEYKTIGLPGYFSQGDLLTVLAPTLTCRGDSFTIRAYGESIDTNGNVVAQAYCEAIVQRGVSFVDSTDKAFELMHVYDSATHTWSVNQASSGTNKGLSKENLTYGRRFSILSFRWLNNSEI